MKVVELLLVVLFLWLSLYFLEQSKHFFGEWFRVKENDKSWEIQMNSKLVQALSTQIMHRKGKQVYKKQVTTTSFRKKTTEKFSGEVYLTTL